MKVASYCNGVVSGIILAVLCLFGLGCTPPPTDVAYQSANSQSEAVVVVCVDTDKENWSAAMGAPSNLDASALYRMPDMVVVKRQHIYTGPSNKKNGGDHGEVVICYEVTLRHRSHPPIQAAGR